MPADLILGELLWDETVGFSRCVRDAAALAELWASVWLQVTGTIYLGCVSKLAPVNEGRSFAGASRSLIQRSKSSHI